MFKYLAPLSLILSTVFIYSCHKSNNGAGSSGQLTGNYKFLYISAITQSVNSESQSGQSQQTVTNSSYTTTNNTGTVQITADSIISTGIGYSASFTSIGYIYVNNVLSDSTSSPSTASITNSNTTTKYDIIGQDSIYFEGGYPVPGATSGPTIAPPSGGRFSVKGDTLFIVSTFLETIPSQTIGGVTTSGAASGVANFVLLKQ